MFDDLDNKFQWNLNWNIFWSVLLFLDTCDCVCLGVSYCRVTTKVARDKDHIKTLTDSHQEKGRHVVKEKILILLLYFWVNEGIVKS